MTDAYDLAAKIRDAVAEHAKPGTHTQSTGLTRVWGIYSSRPTTVVSLKVRVGDWTTSARVEVNGIDRKGVLVPLRQHLRARLERDRERHEAAVRACEAALAALDVEER